MVIDRQLYLLNLGIEMEIEWSFGSKIKRDQNGKNKKIKDPF